MTATYDTDSTSSVKPTLGQIAKATGLAIAMAVIINTVLYFVSRAAGWLPTMSNQGEITLVPILIFSIVPLLLGAVLYYILSRFLSYERAGLVFAIIGAIVLIGMAITPLTGLQNPTVGAVTMLEIMHLAAGLPAIYFLTKSAG